MALVYIFRICIYGTVSTLETVMRRNNLMVFVKQKYVESDNYTKKTLKVLKIQLLFCINR